MLAEQDEPGHFERLIALYQLPDIQSPTSRHALLKERAHIQRGAYRDGLLLIESYFFSVIAQDGGRSNDAEPPFGVYPALDQNRFKVQTHWLDAADLADGIKNAFAYYWLMTYLRSWVDDAFSAAIERRLSEFCDCTAMERSTEVIIKGYWALDHGDARQAFYYLDHPLAQLNQAEVDKISAMLQQSLGSLESLAFREHKSSVSLSLTNRLRQNFRLALKEARLDDTADSTTGPESLAKGLVLALFLPPSPSAIKKLVKTTLLEKEVRALETEIVAFISDSINYISTIPSEEVNWYDLADLTTLLPEARTRAIDFLCLYYISRHAYPALLAFHARIERLQGLVTDPKEMKAKQDRDGLVKSMAAHLPEIVRLDVAKQIAEETVTDERRALKHRPAQATLAQPVKRRAPLRSPLRDDSTNAIHYSPPPVEFYWQIGPPLHQASSAVNLQSNFGSGTPATRDTSLSQETDGPRMNMMPTPIRAEYAFSEASMESRGSRLPEIVRDRYSTSPSLAPSADRSEMADESASDSQDEMETDRQDVLSGSTTVGSVLPTIPEVSETSADTSERSVTPQERARPPRTPDAALDMESPDINIMQSRRSTRRSKTPAADVFSDLARTPRQKSVTPGPPASLSARSRRTTRSNSVVSMDGEQSRMHYGSTAESVAGSQSLSAPLRRSTRSSSVASLDDDSEVADHGSRARSIGKGGLVRSGSTGSIGSSRSKRQSEAEETTADTPRARKKTLSKSQSDGRMTSHEPEENHITRTSVSNAQPTSTARVAGTKRKSTSRASSKASDTASIASATSRTRSGLRRSQSVESVSVTDDMSDSQTEVRPRRKRATRKS